MSDIGMVLAAKGSDVATIGRGATLKDAAAELAERRIGALVVTSEPLAARTMPMSLM